MASCHEIYYRFFFATSGRATLQEHSVTTCKADTNSGREAFDGFFFFCVPAGVSKAFRSSTGSLCSDACGAPVWFVGLRKPLPEGRFCSIQAVLGAHAERSGDRARTCRRCFGAFCGRNSPSRHFGLPLALALACPAHLPAKPRKVFL